MKPKSIPASTVAHISCCLALFLNAYSFVFAHLKDTAIRETGRQRQARRSSVCWFTLPMPAMPGLGQTNMTSPDLNPGLTSGWQGPKQLSHHLVPPRYIHKKRDLQVEAGLRPRPSATGCKLWLNPLSHTPTRSSAPRSIFIQCMIPSDLPEHSKTTASHLLCSAGLVWELDAGLSVSEPLGSQTLDPEQVPRSPHLCPFPAQCPGEESKASPV